MSYKVLSGKGTAIAAKRLAEKRKANKAIPDTAPYHRQQRLWKDGAGNWRGHDRYRA